MAQPTIAPAPPAPNPAPKGHPQGLYTLFFTEMWERFSYYGMRALLVLFLVDQVRGGMGLNDKLATAIYGLYTAGVYLAALPGGWVADRFLGAQRAVWYGGILIALGQFTLVFARGETFYVGLLLVIAGTGLLKPNVSAIVGGLYPPGDGRRDAGFSIFYMGINLGAFLGPLVSGDWSKRYGWHLGFAAAGAGMVLGLVQYRLTRGSLGEAGLRPGHAEGVRRRDWLLLAGLVGGIVIVTGLAFGGVVRLDPLALARGTSYVIVGLAVLYFLVAFLFFDLDGAEKKRLAVIGVLFLASAIFWSGFEQAGSSLNLFAERYTQRALLRFEVPAEWFQSLGPLFVIGLAPVMALVWVALARRGRDPSLPVKFAWGLLLLAGGFLVMAGASQFVGGDKKVWPTWLICTYLLHTFGELCVSPVGLSSVTKLAPRRLVGQMMGIWFLATSLGNLIAGLLAGEFNAAVPGQMSARYLQIVLTAAGSGLVLFCLAPWIKRLTGGEGRTGR
jgi:proton-dependent oligopeptide transporter, POT family